MAELTHPSIRSFLEYLKYEKRYSAHTILSYQNDLADLVEFLESRFDGIALTDINHNLVRTWLAGLKDKGLSGKTIIRKISTLRSFFKYCLKTGVIEASPMGKVITPKAGKRLPSFVKEEDTQQLLKALERSTDDWKSLNAKLLIGIFYATGMRLSELLNLKEKQVDFGRSQLKVLGKGNKERIIPVSPSLLNMIRSYQEQKSRDFEKTDDVLLVTEKGNKIYPRYAWLLVNTYLGMTSTLEKKSPHILRHTFATHLMNNGASLNAVKELLGHSSLGATQVYTHNTIGKLKDIHKKSHPKS